MYKVVYKCKGQEDEICVKNISLEEAEQFVAERQGHRERYFIVDQGGRPKSSNPKNHNIKVRLDEDELNWLVDYAAKQKLTVAAAIRKLIENQMIYE